MKMYKDETDDDDKDSFDQYATRDQPLVKSYGYDERDGPPEEEEEEERGYVDDPPDHRRW